MRAAALSVLCLTGCSPPEWVRANAGSEVAFEAVHGTGPNDVWAVGDLGTITHFNGKTWTPAVPLTSVHLRAIAALATNDVWAFGDSGTALHFDGTSWNRAVVGSDKHLVAAVAAGPKDLWVLPDDVHYLLHWDGTSWTQIDATTKTGYGQCLGGNGPNNLWLMPSSTSSAYIVTPSGVAEIPLELSGDFNCRAISAQSLIDAWFLEDDRVLHYDGRLFRPTAPQYEALSATFYARGIFASAPNEAWVVGSGAGVYHVKGDNWIASTPPSYGGGNLNAIWGAHTDNLWAAGAAGVVQHHAPATVVP
jgi:hypothetical protein